MLALSQRGQVGLLDTKVRGAARYADTGFGGRAAVEPEAELFIVVVRNPLRKRLSRKKLVGRRERHCFFPLDRSIQPREH